MPGSSTSASAACMPSPAKASAMARPSPLAAPVTAATLPSSVFIQYLSSQSAASRHKVSRNCSRKKPKWPAEARVLLLCAQRADEVIGVPAPARPLYGDTCRDVLALAERGSGEIAEQARDPRQQRVREQPHPRARGAAPVAPVAALRADRERRRESLGTGYKGE